MITPTDAEIEAVADALYAVAVPHGGAWYSHGGAWYSMVRHGAAWYLMARAAFAALPASIQRVPEWQPIETAPKDGRKVDLWCVAPEAEGLAVRLTDCNWRPDIGWMRVIWGDHGHPEADPVEGPPVSSAGFPPWRPTHWHPTPLPPPPVNGDPAP